MTKSPLTLSPNQHLPDASRTSEIGHIRPILPEHYGDSYRPHPSFQGSGTDYLAHATGVVATPVVATAIANMAELIGPAGHVAPPGRADLLAAGLDTVVTDPAAATAAAARAPRFTAAAHAARCLAIYHRAAASGDEPTSAASTPPAGATRGGPAQPAS